MYSGKVEPNYRTLNIQPPQLPAHDNPVVSALNTLITEYLAGTINVLCWQVIGPPTMPIKLCDDLPQALAIAADMPGKPILVPNFT